MNYKIEKNIKQPEVNSPRKKGMRNKYEFGEMEIGDSFVFGEYSLKDYNKLANAARNWANYHNNGYVFQLAKTEDNKIRIWRIK
jgi:hypothetical protein